MDQNLIQQREQEDGEPRFLRLESIREFSLECLRASGEEATIRRNHLDYFLDLAEQAEPFLTGPQQGNWLGRLAQEQDNLRVAMQFALEIRQSRSLPLGIALWRFWLVHGHLQRGRRATGSDPDSSGFFHIDGDTSPASHRSRNPGP